MNSTPTRYLGLAPGFDGGAIVDAHAWMGRASVRCGGNPLTAHRGRYDVVTRFDTQKGENPSVGKPRGFLGGVGLGLAIRRHAAIITPRVQSARQISGLFSRTCLPRLSPGSAARGYRPRARIHPRGRPKSRKTRLGDGRAPARERVCGAPGWVLRPEATDDRPTV